MVTNSPSLLLCLRQSILMIGGETVERGHGRSAERTNKPNFGTKNWKLSQPLRRQKEWEKTVILLGWREPRESQEWAKHLSTVPTCLQCRTMRLWFPTQLQASSTPYSVGPFPQQISRVMLTGQGSRSTALRPLDMDDKASGTLCTSRKMRLRTFVEDFSLKSHEVMSICFREASVWYIISPN